MSRLSIEASSDSYKDEIANLIVNIQIREFGIPITLGMQPDLMEIPKRELPGEFPIMDVDVKINSFSIPG